MPFTMEQRELWIDDNGEFFYYYAGDEDTLRMIAKRGLIPRADTGKLGNHPTLPSREDHVYLLATDSAVHRLRVGIGDGVPELRVKVRQLNLDAFASDEDRIEVRKQQPSERIRSLPGFSEIPRLKEGEDLTEWAQRCSAIIDGPEWVEVSLRRGSIAYRGTIPPDLFTASGLLR